MELLVVVVIGISLGLIVRYVLPNRDTHGALLLPAISGAATSIVWVSLLWLGQRSDGGWIWVASLLAAFISALAAGLLLPRRRAEADDALFAELSGGKA
ncbi:MAG: hypothetical protein LH471_01060 [Salinibacterium sp.]|nr:hypothetical protein [Salinibacterium sp.]